MTINELQTILQEEINKGNGEKEVGYISIEDSCLSILTKNNIGYYTETWGRNGKVCGSATSFIIGNLEEANEEESY